MWKGARSTKLTISPNYDVLSTYVHLRMSCIKFCNPLGWSDDPPSAALSAADIIFGTVTEWVVREQQQ